MLDEIRIASPCKVSWDEMAGDEQSRHCGLCRLNVYDLSAMTREAAEALIREREGRLCVRLYRRSDGTVLTSDCPARRQSIRRRLVMAAGSLLTLFGMLLGAASIGRRTDNPFRRLPMVQTVLDMIDRPLEMGEPVRWTGP